MADNAATATDGLGPIVATLRQFGLALANGLVLTALGAVNLANELGGNRHVVWLVMWSTALLLGPMSMWMSRRPMARIYRRGLVTGLVPFRRRREHRWDDVAIAGGAGKRELRSIAGDKRLLHLTGFNVHDAAGDRLDWQSGWRLIRDTALGGGAEDRTASSSARDQGEETRR